MARNIEIKAHISDIRGCGEIAAAIAGGGPLEELVQADTYFNVPVGRLKLREFADESNPGQLIFYARSDQSEPRPSDYHILEVTEPAALKDVLALALGVKAVVKKNRSVYLFGNVRIHLDEVAGLGTFLELEAVLDEDHVEEDAVVSLKGLMRKFSITEKDLLGVSYCELVEDSP